MTIIPAFCLTCGRVFPSQILNVIGGNVRLHAMGNIETCQYCGGMAQTADGVFEITGNILRVVSAPQITRDMLAELRAVVTKAFLAKEPLEQVAQEVEAIHPSFGPLVRRPTLGNYLLILILILWTMRSCTSLNIKIDANINLDVNELFDQWMHLSRGLTADRGRAVAVDSDTGRGNVSRSPPFLPKLQFAIVIASGWGICAWVFGFGNGMAIASFGLLILLTARQWVEERIAERIAAREPRVWHFYFRLTRDFAERAVTAAGISWQAENFDGRFSPDFKIEEHPQKLRVHQWEGGERYVWKDYKRSLWPRDGKANIWSLEVRDRDGLVPYHEWRLTTEERLEGNKRAVSLTLSACRTGRGESQETTEVIFSVPLDEEMLDQERGTGQEHGEWKWAGQSAADNRDWYWSVRRES
jgi:hypothetical protein